jgi:chloride channel 3/4/5
MITLACCIGHSIPQQMSKVTKNPWVSERKKREIMSASAAAGMGVAFGAPIGGVLFSLEELSSFFSAKTMLKSFFCTLIATVSLQMIDPYRGKRVLYQMSYSRDWNFFELIFFVLLGIFGGLSGALFIRLNLKIRRLKRMNRWWDSHPIIEVMVLVLLTAFVSYLNPFTKLDNTELLGYLFRECEEGNFGGLCDYEQGLVTSVSLLIALIINFLLTVLTFGVSVRMDQHVSSI